MHVYIIYMQFYINIIVCIDMYELVVPLSHETRKWKFIRVPFIQKNNVSVLSFLDDLHHCIVAGHVFNPLIYLIYGTPTLKISQQTNPSSPMVHHEINQT